MVICKRVGGTNLTRDNEEAAAYSVTAETGAIYVNLNVCWKA